MSGLSDYTAQNELNFLTGQKAQPALPSVFLALFTVVGVDAGTGFTEVSGGSYARQQVAGTLLTNGTTSTSSGTLHFGTVPAWVVPGMSVLDATGAATQIGTGVTVTGTTTTTVTISSVPASQVGNGDTITFSAFAAAAGSQPSTDTNSGATITFPQATANWGTVVGWGLYDAATTGNLLLWDFLGNFAWLPASVSSAASGTGAVFTTKAHGYSANDPVVDTVEFGGTQPTVTQGTLTGYTINYVGASATDTFSLTTQSAGIVPIFTTSTGAVMLRKVTQQSIPANVTASFATSAFTLSAA